MTGFTNVVWQARPTEQLAKDLGDGAGLGSMADAGAGWTRLSAVLADAGVDYLRIMARLGISWESAHSDHAFAKLRTLAPWFVDAAAAAADNAGRVAAQCAATTVARLAMPNLPEIEVTKGVRDTAAAVGTALGTPIGGVAADAERALHDQKQRAARVMETYESASEPLARPWTNPPPPEVVSSVALASEEASRQHRSAPAAPGLPTAPGGSAGMGPVAVPIAAAAPREKSRFAATVVAGSSVGPTVAEPAASTAAPRPTSPIPPMAPMVGGLMPNSETSARQSRSVPSAGIDAGGTETANTMIDWAHFDRPATAVEPSDPRYSSGVLDLPSTTSIPAVLGAGDQDR
ncbi:PPE domain-containing protein [Williamsia soli]|uniref:PPE domain-containing protein n=1 Tax=Williamsia soli TaxID=364929 RepID=UPI001A9F80BF|nr:PPE domain-containing protein [Williamsia soli]